MNKTSLNTNHCKLETFTDLFAIVVMFTICNPYISIIKMMSSDIQIEPLVFACFWIVMFLIVQFKKKIPVSISLFNLLFLVFFIYSVSISLLMDSFYFRGFGAYVSIFVFSLFGLLIRDRLDIFLKVVKFSAVLSLCVGIFELLVDVEAFKFLVSSIRTGPGRGVTGLTPEPSFYSITCLLYIFVIDILETHAKKKAPYILLLMFQIIFLAKSMTAAIGLFVWLFFRLVTFEKFKLSSLKMIGYILISPIILLNIVNVLPQSRLKYLSQRILNDPIKTFITDESANDRIGDIIYSLNGFVQQYPYIVGHGTNYWSEYLAQNRELFTWIKNSGGNRIMSGYGAAVFEIGVMGVFLILTILIIFWHRRRSNLRAVGLSFTVFLFVAVPLATPLIGTLIGLAMAIRYHLSTQRS